MGKVLGGEHLSQIFGGGGGVANVKANRLPGADVIANRDRAGLVVNVTDVDNETGAISIGDYVRTRQTIRFHVRDAATATEDLAEMLSPQHLSHRSEERPVGKERRSPH